MRTFNQNNSTSPMRSSLPDESQRNFPNPGLKQPQGRRPKLPVKRLYIPLQEPMDQDLSKVERQYLEAENEITEHLQRIEEMMTSQPITEIEQRMTETLQAFTERIERILTVQPVSPELAQITEALQELPALLERLSENTHTQLPQDDMEAERPEAQGKVEGELPGVFNGAGDLIKETAIATAAGILSTTLLPVFGLVGTTALLLGAAAAVTKIQENLKPLDPGLQDDTIWKES